MRIIILLVFLMVTACAEKEIVKPAESATTVATPEPSPFPTPVPMDNYEQGAIEKPVAQHKVKVAKKSKKDKKKSAKKLPKKNVE